MSLPVLYPLRPQSSAIVRFTAAPRHRRRITIDHQPLAGVNPEMLLDWFTHLGETMPYGGQIVPRYLAWHPLDHIRWELAKPDANGGAGEGAQFRIVEAFGAQPEFGIDVVNDVEKLDETGLRMVKRVAGIEILRLEHTWSAGSDGAHYVTVMDLGTRSAWLGAANRIVMQKFPERKVHAWVKHNIEEVGQLEYLLPALRSGKAEPAQRA